MLGCMTMATAAVPPAELAMVSTRSVLEKFFFIVERLSEFLWSVAVVITKNPSESHVFFLCNSVLIDLAKAKSRWTEKKR